MLEPHFWPLVVLQMIFGISDTLAHHEFSERLAWRPSQKNELKLHGARNLIYSVIFLVLGWSVPNGDFAVALIALLAVEIAITLADFVEEDRTRRLPSTERVLHTLLALNYGAILCLLFPALILNSENATALAPAYYGIYSWMCAAAAAGTALFGVRDLAAAGRCDRLAPRKAALLAAGLRSGSRILITGATGFVGQRLVESLIEAGADVSALVRNPKRAGEALKSPVRMITNLDQISSSERFDAIVHLAGEPLANGLWTPQKKKKFVESRVRLTNELIAFNERLAVSVPVFIAASAVGWYGLRDDTALTESDSAICESFSCEACSQIENAAAEAQNAATRVVSLRIGLVLDPAGGMLARMLFPFEFGFGGRFGDGRQMMSWISRDDLVRLIIYAIRNRDLCGALNATAPAPISNGEFASLLGRTLGRPAVFHIPAAPLRFVLGDLAHELFLSGQAVLPEKAMMAGFQFADEDLEKTMRQILGSKEKSAPRRMRVLARKGGVK